MASMNNKRKTRVYKSFPASDELPAVWRTAMAYTYMLINVCDFIIFPILWSAAQAAFNGGKVETEWHPLTLQGGGLLHIAFGAILGVSAMRDNIYRVVEKVRTGHEPVIIEEEIDDEDK